MKLNVSAAANRNVLRMQDFFMPNRIPVVLSPTFSSPFKSRRVVFTKPAPTQKIYGKERVRDCIENADLVVQPTAKATNPKPRAFESKSKIGLPFNLTGGIEYAIPKIIDSKTRMK